MICILLQGIPDFEWHPVVASNISHLNIGNMMEMDQGLPNHRRVAFWQALPVYWNSDRSVTGCTVSLGIFSLSLLILQYPMLL